MLLLSACGSAHSSEWRQGGGEERGAIGSIRAKCSAGCQGRGERPLTGAWQSLHRGDLRKAA